MKDTAKTKAQLIEEVVIERTAELQALVESLQADITERKRAEEVLRKSEDRYRSLYNKTPAMLHSIDGNGRLFAVSDRWLEVLGYERSAVIGRKSVEFLTEESRHYAETVTFPEFSKTGFARDISYQFVKKNGEIVDILLSAIVEYDEKGKYIQRLGVLEDVTGRKQAEQALRESEQRFRTMTEASPLGVFLVNAEGKNVYSNAAWCQLTGYTKEEALGDGYSKVTHPEDRDLASSEWEACMQNQTTYDSILRNLRKDGETIWVRVKIAPIRDGPALIGYVGVTEDITERKRTEKELKKRQAKLAQQNVLLNEKNIALREVMQQVGEEKERMEDQIQANVDRLLIPILSKLKAKTLQFNEQVVDILEDNLRNLTKPFGSRITNRMYSLSQREIEICSMIKSGLSSKEIARSLSISYRTVETHRNRIRKKLGITNKRINFRTHLNSL